MRSVWKLGMFLLLAMLVLGACGPSKKNTNEPVMDTDEANNDTQLVNKQDEEGGNLDYGDGYGFSNFDLDIEVDGQDAIDAEYKVDRNADAEFVNKLAGVNLKGDEAFDKLDELFMQIMFTSDLGEQEVIDKIMQYFGLDTYSKFDLEIDFDNGKKMDIEKTQ